LGSSQTLPLPHLSTLAASRFCSLSDTIFSAADRLLLPAGCVVRRKGLEECGLGTRRLIYQPDGGLGFPCGGGSLLGQA
jgi:hypothetical protein